MQRPTDEQLPELLGWASLGLGIPMTFMTERFDRSIGVRPDRGAKRWTRIVGMREFAHAAGILALEKPRPLMSVWGRVAGDVKDAALLMRALRTAPHSRPRIGAALGAASLIGALDVYTAMRLSSAADRGSETPATAKSTEDSRMSIRKAITIRKPQDEVERGWREYNAEWADHATVRIMGAPGDRGTEIHVQMSLASPKEAISATLKGLMGDSPAQRIGDDLRRFKQMQETGIIVRSEGTPEGPSTKRFMRQRPAQPLPDGELAQVGARS
jgi:hypothetical protein